MRHEITLMFIRNGAIASTKAFSVSPTTKSGIIAETITQLCLAPKRVLLSFSHSDKSPNKFFGTKNIKL